MRVISLGWGLQSFALAAMSALGELPPVDAAIHADTTHERTETYEFAKRWTPWLEERGVKVVTVKASKRRLSSVIDPDYQSSLIPAYTRKLDGSKAGTLLRQCTADWKIQPIKQWLQKHRKGQRVTQWIGITLDEIQRMKPSRVKYITLKYPFIEQFDPPMYRWQVAQWLQDNGLELPVKSSCVFCPYHDQATWREIKMSSNGDWKRAISADEVMRHKRDKFICYVHRQRIPLAEVDLRNETDHGQLSLWDEECEGYCFL